MNQKAQSKQAARFASIEARLTAIEDALNPRARKPEPQHLGYGPARDASGNVIADPDAPSWEQRMAERRANEERGVAAERAERAANGGRYRDPMGIWREADGRQVATAALEHSEVREVMKEQGTAPRFVGGAKSPNRKR